MLALGDGKGGDDPGPEGCDDRRLEIIFFCVAVVHRISMGMGIEGVPVGDLWVPPQIIIAILGRCDRPQIYAIKL